MSWGLGEDAFISNGLDDDSRDDNNDADDDGESHDDDDDGGEHLAKLSWKGSAEIFSEKDNLSSEQVLTNLIFQQFIFLN